MKTRLPISSISYNSNEFLKQKLDELTRAKILEFWAFIRHLPEEDETKEHIHLYMKPAKMIQTVDLKEEFAEFDPLNPEKPFSIINIKSSKFPDWYLYAIHDKAYLAAKGQTRKYHYKYEDVIASDPDELRERVRDIDMLEITPVNGMKDAIQNGLTFKDYFRSGRVPMAQLNQYKEAWRLLCTDHRTYRNGKPNHEDPDQTLTDPETGEVLKKGMPVVDPVSGDVIGISGQDFDDEKGNYYPWKKDPEDIQRDENKGNSIDAENAKR